MRNNRMDVERNLRAVNYDYPADPARKGEGWICLGVVAILIGYCAYWFLGAWLIVSALQFFWTHPL